jgi:ATP-binding cassette subfamily G (WHITE) protein 1
MIGTLSIFSSETPVVIREISSGYYTSVGYYFSKIAIEIPFQILSTLISCTIIYILSHFQRKLKKYLKFIGVVELGSLCGLSIGLSIATIAKDVTLALQFAPFLVIPLILFSGLFINSGSIPPYFTWIQYISPVKYMFQEVYKNEIYDLDDYDDNLLHDHIEQMKFNKISSILSIVLLATITLILYIFCYLMLFASIKKSLSKTKYISSKGENNLIKPNELNEPLLYND